MFTYLSSCKPTGSKCLSIDTSSHKSHRFKSADWHTRLPGTALRSTSAWRSSRCLRSPGFDRRERARARKEKERVGDPARFDRGVFAMMRLGRREKALSPGVFVCWDFVIADKKRTGLLSPTRFSALKRTECWFLTEASDGGRERDEVR